MATHCSILAWEIPWTDTLVGYISWEHKSWTWLSVGHHQNVVAVIQSLSCVQFFATTWTAACQASPSFTISQSLLKLMFIELVIPSNHLILCRPLLLPPSIFPSIRIFSNESALHIRWPKYWSFSFNISPTNEYSGLLSFRKSLLTIMENIDLFSNQRKIWTEKGKLRGKVRSEMT